MPEPVQAPPPKRSAEPTGIPKRDMGLRTHVRELIGSTRTMSTLFIVLLVLIIIGAGCALLLR